MLWSIERIESGAALLEDDGGNRRRIPAKTLPDGAREGDMLREDGERYRIDGEETARRRAEAARRLARLTAKGRRHAIAQAIAASGGPVSASALADRFHVSRQAIVGDVALLRAEGEAILATPRGYVREPSPAPNGVTRTVACRHDGSEQLAEELYLVVDQGGTVQDVVVEHPVYGQISGQLQLSSRYDVDRFLRRLAESDAAPLSRLTGGLHLHTISCPDEACLRRVIEALRQAGILFAEEEGQ